MSGYKERLLQQFEQAAEAVKKSGEDRYICEGLNLAKLIVEAGPDANASDLVGKILEGFGI